MKKTELPTAVYAAAGAGDLAYRKLRELRTNLNATDSLRDRAGALRGRAEALRERVRAGDQDLAAGLAVVRESARHTAVTLASRAVAAQEKAATGYRSLVARGERLVNDRLGETTGPAEPPVKAEIVVGDPDDAPASTNPSSTESSPESSTGTPKPSSAGSSKPASASRRASNPNGRGVGKTGSTPAGKRAAG